MRPWGIWATLAWAVVVLVLAQAVGMASVAWWFGGPSSVAAMRYDGAVIALGTIVADLLEILMLGRIARLSGWNAASYLGLTRFCSRDGVIGLLAVGALVVALDVFGYVAGFELVSPFQTEAYSTARAEGWLPVLAFAVIIVGPAGEEIFFRGFLFRGWVRPGPAGAVAILVISLLWSGLHIQYDWFGMLQVFLTGLALGWVRWRSGSTTLTALLHGLINLARSKRS